MHRAIRQAGTLGVLWSPVASHSACIQAAYVTCGTSTRAPLNPVVWRTWNSTGSRELLSAAALLSALTIGTAWASTSSDSAEEPTSLQMLHLRMLRQWLTENEADVASLDFSAVDVRTSCCF
jgi:hypothetical protein